MKTTPRITDAEWTVMRVLWREHPLTAKEVHRRLQNDASWTALTVKTLINRLYEKGALTRQKVSRAFEFRPAIAESACRRAENRSFLERVYGGAVQPMLTTLLEEEDLSPEDIAELRALLDRKEGSE